MPACFLLVLGGFFLGFSGSVDDAHITYWPAWTLAHEGQLLNFNFEHIEQSSALGQVLLLAMLHKLTGLPVVTLAHVSTLFAALLCLWLTAKTSAGLHVAQGEPATGMLAALLLATSPFFVYWSYAGMEGPWLALLMLAMLVVVASFLQHGTSVFPLFAVSLATQMMRPEAPAVLCVFGATVLLLAILLQQRSPWTWRRALPVLCVQLIVALLLVSWRADTFHAWLPQPVNAKTGGALWPQLLAGWQYLRTIWMDRYLILSGLLLLAGAVYVVGRLRVLFWQLGVLMLLVYAAFVIGSGGDWMAAGRFWVPVMPLVALLTAQALCGFFQHKFIRYALLLVILVSNIAYLWRGTALDFNSVPLWSANRLLETDGAAGYSFFEKHARENLQSIPLLAFVKPVLGQLVAARQQQQPVQIMAGQMGMVPFYLSQAFPRQLRFTDRNGITETLLTDCPVARGLPRTRNGIGTGYAWVLEHRTALAAQCGFVMPDLVFDIDTGWNKRNIQALEQAGYVFIYRQRDRQPDATKWLPLRPIYASLFIAASPGTWRLLGSPAPVNRDF
ncbi:MAG TPA: hypothetical protein PLF22_00935 [Pseudomonadales bacterium]|nr:hypothetical protein [Pseudomonadales bacterium]